MDRWKPIPGPIQSYFLGMNRAITIAIYIVDSPGETWKPPSCWLTRHLTKQLTTGYNGSYFYKCAEVRQAQASRASLEPCWISLNDLFHPDHGSRQPGMQALCLSVVSKPAVKDLAISRNVICWLQLVCRSASQERRFMVGDKRCMNILTTNSMKTEFELGSVDGRDPLWPDLVLCPAFPRPSSWEMVPAVLH